MGVYIPIWHLAYACLLSLFWHGKGSPPLFLLFFPSIMEVLRLFVSRIIHCEARKLHACALCSCLVCVAFSILLLWADIPLTLCCSIIGLDGGGASIQASRPCMVLGHLDL